jgi:tRNA/rRNA methyltransferase
MRAASPLLAMPGGETRNLPVSAGHSDESGCGERQAGATYERRVRYHRNIATTDWKENLRVVMVSTRNPLNIGAAARAMANFGFVRLAVVNPYDVAFREARSAVGAAPLLQTAVEFSSVAEAVADCRLVVGTTSVGHRELQHPIRRLEYGARLIHSTLLKANAALLFGSEKFGLSNGDLSHCHWLIRIPTVGQDLSMNLGQAVALCLYELARDPKAATVRPEKIRAATAGETAQIAERLLATLRKSGYVNPTTASSTEEKIRRLVLRLNIGARDATVLLGMLRQILWKLDG